MVEVAAPDERSLFLPDRRQVEDRYHPAHLRAWRHGVYLAEYRLAVLCTHGFMPLSNERYFRKPVCLEEIEFLN